MKPYRYVLIALVLGGLLVGGCASTQRAQGPAETPPPAKSIEADLVEKSIAARGGLANIKAIASMIVAGEARMPSMGLTMPLMIYLKRPANVRTEVEIESMGVEIVSGYDGQTAWTDNPLQGGSQTLSGEQARSMIQQADLDGVLVDYRDKGVTVEYVGEEPVRGAAAHKLKVTRPDSSVSFVYLDAATFLQVKSEGEGTNPMSGAKTTLETYLTDYRDVAGTRMPFAMEVFMDKEVFQRITFVSVKTNAEIDDQLFAMPKN